MASMADAGLPQADAGGDAIKRKLRGHIARRNLAGAASAWSRTCGRTSA